MRGNNFNWFTRSCRSVVCVESGLTRLDAVNTLAQCQLHFLVGIRIGRHSAGRNMHIGHHVINPLLEPLAKFLPVHSWIVKSQFAFIHCDIEGTHTGLLFVFQIAKIQNNSEILSVFWHYFSKNLPICRRAIKQTDSLPLLLAYTKNKTTPCPVAHKTKTSHQPKPRHPHTAIANSTLLFTPPFPFYFDKRGNKYINC